MSSSENKPRPGLRFTWLIVITAIVAAIIAAGSIWGKASWTPNLALDLEGGTSIILEPQLDEGAKISKEQLQQAVAIIRQRVDSTGVSEAEISTQGDQNIVVNLPGNPDKQTRDLVRSSAQLAFRRVAAVGAPQPAGQESASPSESKSPEMTDEQKKKLEDLLGKQSETGKAGGTVSKQAASAAPAGGPSASPTAKQQDSTEAQKIPRFDPAADQSWASEKIQKQFAELDCTNPENRTGGKRLNPDQPVVACSKDGQEKYVLGPVELDGSHVKDASFGYETSSSGQQTNNLAVSMEFDGTGRDVFGKVTSAITGQQQPYNQFAITLDGLVLTAPVSQSAVTDGRAQITGSFTQEEAETLANQLKNGALPISFQVQSEEQISPTLGSEYLTKGLLAGGIGLLLVIVYSLFQYRALASVTVSSLVVAGILTYLLLLFVSWRYGYRLSLAGVAGIIVGIGMTADSFIVYFERVRDELRDGRPLKSAVEVGWSRAGRTIYASKAVNMLAAVILYILAVGSVRGFAFTLGLTVIVDVLVVVLFTHPMLQALARTEFFGNGHPMSGMDPRLLGVKPAAYRGALGLDLERAKEKSKKGKSFKEAKRRQARTDRKAEDGMSIAERKAALKSGEDE
ncbi:protein translocase subunit SecD [Brevibacterium sp. 50QC2O2]|uniref:protein translocase subunit SecD n=1 Tax=Brevibacterium sp. 50QC2O2 TaxID=2968459 RepID=UPI00211C95AD|nr:protein translocase subunit SecD [Brevibacterium sp. 50QC2O2]